MLAAACYLLPTEMRQMARAGVPTIWAWPTVSWINHPDRDTELTVAAAMTQAVIELYDRTDGRQSRPPHWRSLTVAQPISGLQSR